MRAIVNRLFLLSPLFLFVTQCTYHDTRQPVDCDASGPSIELDTTISASKCSAADGSIYIKVSGGTSPFQYFANNVLTASAEIRNLSAGTYTIKVVDANGCEATLKNISVLADGFTFKTTLEPDHKCLQGDGSATVEITEGVKPYTFKIDNGLFSEDSVFHNLQEGEHLVVVKDAEDCETTLRISIPHGSSEVLWTTDILPIMTTYCAKSGCHDGITRSNDFKKYSNVKFYSKEIKRRTRDKTMPEKGTLTQNQIDLISCWIDDGAMNN